MKIVKLTAENVKRLVAVEIAPSGNLVQITGRNGQGKTSVLDAIWWALDGAKHIQAKPIRKGAKRAFIKLDLGDLIVERRFTEGGGSLFVSNAEGARYPSPQAMLDALIGALTFDPLKFASDEPRAQFETLRGLVKIDVDLDALDRANREDFEARTIINRDAKSLQAQADAISVAPETPDDPIDISAIMDELTHAATTNAAIERERSKREQIANNALTDRATAREYRAEIARLETEATRREQEAEKKERSLMAMSALPYPVNAEDLRRRLNVANEENKAISAKARKRQLEADAKRLTDNAERLTDAINSRIAGKSAAIAAAEMPVEGLGLGDGIVTYNDLPFDQASTAEQLRVSVGIAMAANPKLRVLRIKHGNDLDAENLELLADMAKARDYQIWIERVDSSGKVGIVIEDGVVASIDGKPVECKEDGE